MTIEDGFGRRCLVASSSFYVIKRSSKIQIAQNALQIAVAMLN